METKKLYLESIEAAYHSEFSAKVLAIEENKVVLDQTLFYPLGGGQNWDLGTLEGPNGQMDVVEVRGRDSIYHTIEDIFELDVGDARIFCLDVVVLSFDVGLGFSDISTPPNQQVDEVAGLGEQGSAFGIHMPPPRAVVVVPLVSVPEDVTFDHEDLA